MGCLYCYIYVGIRLNGLQVQICRYTEYLKNLIMTNKRKIIFYDDLNGPYLESLRQGLIDTPEERYVKFFQEQRRFREIVGIKKDPNAKKVLTISKPSWI